MKLSSRLILASVALVCFTAAAVAVIGQWSLERELVPASLFRLESSAENLVGNIGTYVASATADVRILRGTFISDSIVRARQANGVDPQTGRTLSAYRGVLAQLFSAFLAAHDQYIQIRLIESAGEGRELVRVDRVAAGGRSRVVPEEELQTKGSRPYLRATLARPPGSVYVSPVELNREFGTVEVPHVPVVRVATPIHDAEGRPFGILIINVDMRPLFEKLQSAVATPALLYVVNEAGEYLVHPDPGMTFGFDLGKRFRVNDKFPALTDFSRVDSAAVRQVRDLSGEAYWAAIVPAPSQLGRPAFVIVAEPVKSVMAAINALRWPSALIALAVSLVAIAAAILVARTLTRPIRMMANSLANHQGGTTVTMPAGGGEEVRILSDAVNRFVEQERFFRNVLESANDAVITRALDGRITSWNPAAETLYGFTAEEAVGQPIDIIIPEEKRNELGTFFADTERGEAFRNRRTVRKTKDGRRVDVSLTLSPLRDGHGKVVGASAIARDITDALRLQEMVRLSVDASPAGMIVVDAEGNIELANQAAGRMFGYEPEELLGQKIDVLVPLMVRDQRVGERQVYQATPRNRVTGEGRDLRALRRDGSEFPVELALNPLPNDPESRVLAVVVDITERRRAEEEIGRRTLELERSNAELAQFAYVASHDLQEPLRMVASFCELLKQTQAEKLDADGLEYLEFAVDGAQRMQHLIGDLLAYSRLNTRPPEPTNASCAQALENVRRNLFSLIQESGATVTAVDDLPTVHCDRTHLEQIFQNLISNAVKFRREEAPAIEISAQRDGAFWRLCVSDNGIGIDPQHKERIFGVFQRLHTREEYPGTGIGLAVCKRIVERLGGAIWFEPRDGAGTNFYFTLPVAVEAVNDDRC